LDAEVPVRISWNGDITTIPFMPNLSVQDAMQELWNELGFCTFRVFQQRDFSLYYNDIELSGQELLADVIARHEAQMQAKDSPLPTLVLAARIVVPPFFSNSQGDSASDPMNSNSPFTYEFIVGNLFKNHIVLERIDVRADADALLANLDAMTLERWSLFRAQATDTEKLILFQKVRFLFTLLNTVRFTKSL
jgi:hypothetical protein